MMRITSFLLFVGACITSTGAARAEREVHELRYTEAEEAFRKSVSSLLRVVDKAAALPEALRVTEATVGASTLGFDAVLNKVWIDGPEVDRNLIRELLKEIDQKQPQVQVELLLIEARGDGPALGLLAGFAEGAGKPAIAAGGSAFFEDADMKAIAAFVRQHKALSVISRPVVFARNNTETVIQMGEDKADGEENLEIKITPLLNSKDEITLSIDQSLTVGEQISELATTVRLPKATAVALGGLVKKGAEGERVELLLLAKPEALEAK